MAAMPLARELWPTVRGHRPGNFAQHLPRPETDMRKGGLHPCHPSAKVRRQFPTWRRRFARQMVSRGSVVAVPATTLTSFLVLGMLVAEFLPRRTPDFSSSGGVADGLSVRS